MIISLLTLFGITPDKYPFLVLGILIVGGIIYIRFSLGSSLSKVKDNVLVIVTHLTTSNRGKLNPTLIKEMSPLQIQPEGKKVLDDSGFSDAFIKNKDSFFNIVNSKKPTNKLEVEIFSIYSFLEVFGIEGNLSTVKAYLYQHPTVRESFPTLAGVMIRDSYLEDHPEIKQ